MLSSANWNEGVSPNSLHVVDEAVPPPASSPSPSSDNYELFLVGVGGGMVATPRLPLLFLPAYCSREIQWCATGDEGSIISYPHLSHIHITLFVAVCRLTLFQWLPPNFYVVAFLYVLPFV